MAGISVTSIRVPEADCSRFAPKAPATSICASIRSAAKRGVPWSRLGGHASDLEPCPWLCGKPPAMSH